ncbi:hypothetical protein QBC33DRAFT_581402 [Phialemonium atrogriseum]|uniref:CCHC-type domain-containing protein n=1 Tax=Phialemonium atrogriseum TaxID=1093897 RepID=A0AAJ0BR23_9PEZI|nr:uncharacterized protein QBC33DRAFT_581402 [Phialemonium atrogriseum]KAK1762908.1 hypothetical protein QBC33DRAFT_581402 [Phialemonium atrogriseum]
MADIEHVDVTDTKRVDVADIEHVDVTDKSNPPEDFDDKVEHLDGVQDIYNKDGGKDEDWTRPIHGYLSINGEPISTPSAKVAQFIGRPSKESLDVAITMHDSADDFASLHFKLLAHGLGLDDEYAGHILIWAIDLLDIQAFEQPDPLAALRHYRANAKAVYGKVFAMTVKVRSVQFAVPYGIESQLQTIYEGIHQAKQLKMVRECINRAKPDGSITFDLLLPACTGSVELYITKLCNMFMHRRISDTQQSPLQMYFARSPDSKLLTLGDCPAPGEPGFPTNARGMRILHFAKAHQHLLYNVAGTHFDENLQREAIEALPSHQFNAFVFPLAQVEGGRRFLCILDPEGQEVLLPRNGEACNMFFAKAMFLSEDKITSIALEVFKVLLFAIVKADFYKSVVKKAGMHFSRDLTEAEVYELRQTEVEKDDSNNEAWRARVYKWIREHCDILRDMALAEDDNDPARWWAACRVDLPSPLFKAQYQTYMVWKPTNKDAEAEDSLLLGVDLPSVGNPQAGESAVSYLARVMDPNNAQPVKVKRVSSNKTICAEVDAVNALNCPPSADPRPSDESVAAFRYLLRFNADTAPIVNLLEAIPALGNVVNDNSSPPFVKNLFEGMNKPMKEAFRAMDSLPAGICFVPGVAGCGKSYMMEMAIVFSQFGSCAADAEPHNAMPNKLKVLYLINNNAGVEAFTSRLIETYDGLGIANHPAVLRLYPMGSEVRSGMSQGPKQQRPDVFAEGAAEAERAAMDIENHFLATYVMNEISINVHNAHAAARKARRHNVENSLHCAALRYFEGHRTEERFGKLARLLDRLRAGEKLDGKSRAYFETSIKMLYTDFLQDFHGTIVTTPMGASVSAFRNAFRPDIVIMDDAGLMRELTTLVPIVYFSPKVWIIIGDVVQAVPHITMQHDLGPGTTTSNPFAEQLTLSTLARAVDAGATRSYLLINQRAFGNSISVSNHISYHGLMKPSRRGIDNWPEPLREMVAHSRSTIHNTLPPHQCNVLVEFAGSQATGLTTSLTNTVHLAWTLRQVRAIIESELTGLGRNNGKPVDVLVVAFYKAQALEYQKAIKAMVDHGQLPKDVYGRVKVKTLDVAQGDEADFVFVDFVTVSHPGFTGENFRIALATTRARGMSILLLNRGTFVGYDKPETRKRANVLFRLYNYHATRQLTVRIWCCLNSQTDDHTTSNCTAIPPDMSNITCERQSCGVGGHNAATCPTRICRNCNIEGHSANECVEQLICSRCGRDGHVSLTCTATTAHFQCLSCNMVGHATKDCPNKTCNRCGEIGHMAVGCDKPSEEIKRDVICRQCGKGGHMAKDCTQPLIMTCRDCGEPGHLARVCPTRECRRCKGKGHTGADCPTPWCSRCHDSGHLRGGCRKPPPLCGQCKGPHKTENCRVGTERAPRVQPQSFVKHTADVSSGWGNADEHTGAAQVGWGDANDQAPEDHDW